MGNIDKYGIYKIQYSSVNSKSVGQSQSIVKIHFSHRPAIYLSKQLEWQLALVLNIINDVWKSHKKSNKYKEFASFMLRLGMAVKIK